ncbi:MAG: hypothetical protein EBY87_03575, partial [Actinobacteria bacterium]|nr:hypothetical protein [Actinomycetota bacterium]
MSGYLYGLQGDAFYEVATLESVNNQEELVALAEENNDLQRQIIAEQRASRNTMLQIHHEQQVARQKERTLKVFCLEFEHQGYSPLEAHRLAQYELALLDIPSIADYELSKFKISAEKLIDVQRKRIIKGNNFRYGGIAVLIFSLGLFIFWLSFRGKPEPSPTGLVFFLGIDILSLFFAIKGKLIENKIKKAPIENFSDDLFEAKVTELKRETV